MSALDPRERNLVKCEDMRIHAERARRFLGERSLFAFYQDDMVQAAVIRCVEVVGEAARCVSESTRTRTPEIPWSLIVGMRNVLTHDYGAVDLEKVYEVVTRHLVPLLASLQTVIQLLEKEVGWEDRD